MLMRRSTMLGLFAGLLAPVAARAAAPDEDVKAACAAWDAAFNKGDPKAISALYTDDAIVLPPTHDVVRGPTEIGKFFSGFVTNGVTGHKLELIQANGDADVIVAAAKWSAKGKDAPLGGLSTIEFRKQANGDLKIRVHTFN